MSVLLAEVTRGNVVESRHRGFVVVADGGGKVIASAGDPGVTTYMRSAAKPIQALGVVLSGAADRFRLSHRELAIMCASHYGEDMHRQVIHGILDKLGLSVQDLLCGTPLSISDAYRDRQLREGMDLDESNSDCSGKHSGFLAVCKAKGYPIENYNSPGHPLQRDVLGLLSHMSGVPEDRIAIGVDGCGVPVHSLPLVGMARAYARLSTPAQLDEPYRSACARIVAVMNAAPEMVAGTNGFCTELLKHTGGKFCAKLGAEAVYCVGVRDRDMGIAVKIEDGNFRALYPVVMSALSQLDLLSDSEAKALGRFAAPEVVNDLGAVVGGIRPSYRLAFH